MSEKRWRVYYESHGETNYVETLYDRVDAIMWVERFHALFPENRYYIKEIDYANVHIEGHYSN